MRRTMLDYDGPVPVPGLVEAFEMNGVTTEVLLRSLVPALFTLVCMECDAKYTAVLYEQHSEPSLVIIPSEGRGLSTRCTPESVSYYLDQAARAHSIGANSAAIAMFRSALEWILEDQGYQQPMLGPKLLALQSHIKNGTAPAWTTQLHPDVLQTLKDLGNTATHTNGGDISKQQAMDVKLYRAAENSLLEVLEIVYERPAEQAERIGVMRAAISVNPRNG